jgi:hypothetical protein
MRLPDDPMIGPAGHCAECGTALAYDQRYCTACGARRGPLPIGIAVVLGEIADRNRAPVLIPSADPGGQDPPEEPARDGVADLIPLARAAAISILLMLGVGSVIGAATAPGGLTSLASTIVVAFSPSPTPAPTPVASTGGSGGGGGSFGGGSGGSGGGGGGGGAVPAAGPPLTARTVTLSAPPPANSGGGGGPTTAPAATPAALPPIGHVWEIVLSGQGYGQSFGTTTGHPYLSGTLAKQGEVVTNYDAVAGSPLANEVAMVSGQGPTPQTLEDCPSFSDITPAKTGALGQVLGTGCLYPTATQSLAQQLEIAGMTWHAYVQGIGDPGQTHPPKTTGTTTSGTTTSGTTTGATTSGTTTGTTSTGATTTATTAPTTTTQTVTTTGTTVVITTPPPTVTTTETVPGASPGFPAGPTTTSGLTTSLPTATGTAPSLPAAPTPPILHGTTKTVTTTGTITTTGTVTSSSTSASGSETTLADTSTRAACPHPATDAIDTSQTATKSDGYVTWKNPFVYFHAVADNDSLCASDDVGLDQLAKDLKSASTTPSFSYIAPGPCDDGSDVPCHAGAKAGLGQADAFLKQVVPEIEASPAYQQNGLILITFANAPQSGPNWSTASCCDQPTFPNLPATSTTGTTGTGTTGTGTTGTGTTGTGTTGTGTTTTTVGTTTSGTTSGTTTGATTTTDGTTTTASTPTTTTVTVTATATAPTTAPATTTPIGSTTDTGTTSGTTDTGMTTTPGCPVTGPNGATPGTTTDTTTTGPATTTTTITVPVTAVPPTTTDTTPATTTPTMTTTSSTSSTGSSSTATDTTSTVCAPTIPGDPPGGGQVGLLLISPYVQPGTLDGLDILNHFSLLKSVEGLFGLPSLGYAADPQVPAFAPSMFTTTKQ